jgi:hypothetical protein
MAPEMLIYLVFRRKARASDSMRGPTSPASPAIISATDGGAFISPSKVGPPLLSRCHPRTCDNLRNPATKCDFDHRDLVSPVRCTNRLPDCGTSADRSTMPWARDVRFWRMSA